MENHVSGNNYIETVLIRDSCHKHKAGRGVACWAIPSLTHGWMIVAICNSRAKRAGFTGIPSNKSLRRSP